MRIDFNEIASMTFPGMDNGTGMMSARMYNDESYRIIPTAIHPGGSIGTLYMTVWAIKHRTFVNNFAYETAEINIEVKHLLSPKKKRLPRVSWQSF